MSPFRIDPYAFPNRTKIQFTTNAAMPQMIYQACLATGTPSNTVYCQHALVAALSRDLGIPIQSLKEQLPTPRGPSAHLWNPDEGRLNRYAPVHDDPTGGQYRIGPANTVEQA